MIPRTLASALGLLLGLGALASPGPDALPISATSAPVDLVLAPTGDRLYVADRGAGVVHEADPRGEGKRLRSFAVKGRPDDLALDADGKSLYVSERGAGTVAVIDLARGEATSRISVDRWPGALAVDGPGRRLFVACEDSHRVWVFDLAVAPPRLLKKLQTLREPSAIVVAPGGARIAVANRLPHGRGTDADLAAAVSLFDGRTLEPAAPVVLPPGSSGMHGICASPDGRWLYAVHGLGRFKLPMTQLERGWVNTYAVSLVDLAAGMRRATVLLDEVMRGAADPYALAVSGDGRHLWITHSGVHEVSRIDVGGLHELLSGRIPDRLAASKDSYAPGIWARIRKNPAAQAELSEELSALSEAGLISRMSAGGLVPRGLVLAPEGRELYVANFGSGTVSVLPAAGGKGGRILALGDGGEASAARRGEVLFHDATRSFQSWHSCATCHPNDGRVDGLRWDFVDDGLGNGMDTLPLRYLGDQGRLHRLGTLKDEADAARHGLTFTHMIVPTDRQVEDLRAYLASLKSEPSPHLGIDGEPSAEARQGKEIFEGKADCVRCHSGPHGTDTRFYNVLDPGGESAGTLYKTTALVELHRTGPYLHDGRALTIEEVLTTFNPGDRHGRTRGLSPAELAALAAYLRTR